MNPFEALHEARFRERRVRVLQRHLESLLPRTARALDVGCGDGELAGRIARSRPDLRIEGIDVVRRPQTLIPVSLFDGRTIPFDDESFDGAIFVDVLHHADDPAALLAEGARVARDWIAVKDHLLEGPLAGPTLRFMDRTGNARHGVPIPYNYWPRERWRTAFAELGLEVRAWVGRLGLYPWPLGLAFDRSLHFMALLGRARR